jgi:XapX domain-containing protein
MLPYCLSLGVGLAVGIAYGLLGVKSPAPPIIALIGLLGMLGGEMAVAWWRGHPAALSGLMHSKSFAVDSTRRDTQTSQKS